MSGAEERLYGLMEIAEQQQAAVQRALNGLAEERAALAQERQRLADEASGLEKQVREAVSAAVATALEQVGKELEQVGKEGVATVREAAKPLLEDVAGLAGCMAVAEEALRRIVAWTSWRLLGWIVALTIRLMLFGWLSSTALIL